MIRFLTVPPYIEVFGVSFWVPPSPRFQVSSGNFTLFQPCGIPPGEEPQKTADFRQKPDVWHAMIRMCTCQDFLHFFWGFWADSEGHVRKYLIWGDFCIFDPKFLVRKILHIGFEPDRGAY